MFLFPENIINLSDRERWCEMKHTTVICVIAEQDFQAWINYPCFLEIAKTINGIRLVDWKTH